MKKLFLFLMTLMLVACSAPMPTEDVGEVQQALATCAITGDSGYNAFPAQTVITDVRQAAPNGVYGDTHMIVTACEIATGNCTATHHAFDTVHWSNVNGTAWTGSIEAPLRRVVVQEPGCQLNAPTKWCMSFYGDVWTGTHWNLLQNVNRFLSDKPIVAGSIEAPFGKGIARIVGFGGNTWQMRYPGTLPKSLTLKSWSFPSTSCDL